MLKLFKDSQQDEIFNKVAIKALLTWDNVCKVIQHYSSLPKSSRPQNNVSYDTLVRYKDDFFKKVKFHIMKDIAVMLNTFYEVVSDRCANGSFSVLCIRKVIMLLIEVIC